MKIKKIKELLELDSKLLDHAHYMERIKLREKEYNYAYHYSVFDDAKKELEELIKNEMQKSSMLIK